jgi:hypothetical protein
MTQEDIRSFNRHKGTRLFEPSRWDWWSINGANQHEPPSTKWDGDWERLVSCWDPWSEPFFRGPVYPLGALDGLWVGRMIVSPFTKLAISFALNFELAGTQCPRADARALRALHPPALLGIRDGVNDAAVVHALEGASLREPKITNSVWGRP